VRYLLLDRITELSPPERARGVKCVSLSDDVFDEHFPGHPIMPGALLLESMAQLGGVLLEQAHGVDGVHALLTMVDRAKFRKIVRPGDKVELEAQALARRDDGGQVKTLARVDGALVAEAELTFVLTKVTNPVVLEKRKQYLRIWLTGSAEPA
jgi:3-hydroxymyristoyl/3-hydroxydecanoyl-(acyl carrier protein) dehydratase